MPLVVVAPLGLVALGLLPVIYVIHMLRGSRRRVRVPATFLWADLPRAPSGRDRRRWPPPNLLLVLQLLAALLGALALARPAVPGAPPRHLALVLDASASMQATDVAPSRFEAARALASERLGTLGPRDHASLIRADSQPMLLASGSPERVRSALAAAQPGLGSAAIREALALASTQVGATPDARGEIVVVTDAAWPTFETVGRLAAPVEVVPTGGNDENQAVSSLVVRLDPSGRGQTAFVEVANYADHRVQAPLRVLADDIPIDERQVDLPARGRTRLSLPLPLDARHLSARLLGHDALALDDVVETLAPGGPPRDVLLVGSPSTPLRRALEALPWVRLKVADPSASDQPPAELTVLDGTLPTRLPPGPLLLVNPPSSSPRFASLRAAAIEPSAPDAAHPLLQGVDLAALRDETPTLAGSPGWATVVVGTAHGPLVLEGHLDDRPVVALTFDPTLSGVAKSLAFPLLVSNATSHLLAEADSPRLDTAEVFDVAESDIRPRPIPSFETAATPVQPDGAMVELWPYLLVAVLLVLGAEWLVYARRG
jgi:hypothetical protein